MDVRQHLPAFLAEAREQLQQLGLAVLRVEAAPDDRDAAEEIFRLAHTLKGVSATMGFHGIASLTHAMEDVFELLRQRAGGLSPEAVDVLSACLDTLEATLESIAAGGEEQLDAAPLVARLERLPRERTPEQELARDGGAQLPDLTRVPAPGCRIVHVEAGLAAGCEMPAVRAHMLFAALAAHGELVGGVPAPDSVAGGGGPPWAFSGGRVEAWLETAAADAALADTVRAVGEIADVRIGEAPRATPADAPPPTLASAPSRRRAAGTVRVDAERLDELLQLMSELVLDRSAVEAAAADADALAPALQRLARSSQALQTTVMRVRMIPVETAMLRFRRVVRDLAARLGKQVELRLTGGETELDRAVVDALGDPLVQLVRNALDHGLESPAERLAAGKPPTGVLELSARHAGGHVIVSVRDDGRGLDPAAIGRAAVRHGLLEPGAALDPASAAELLFAPGFSTADAVTDVSGRGVGMDVVRASVRALGGDVSLTSEPGAGTLAQLRLPLTLASVAALLVEADGLAFAVPLERIERTVRLRDAVVRTVAGAPLLVDAHDEDEQHALLDPRDVLGTPAAAEPARAFALVIGGVGGERRVALSVDALAGRRELVTRPLPPALAVRAAAAGSVLTDGRIALVVDCDALVAPAATPTSPATAAPMHPCEGAIPC